MEGDESKLFRSFHPEPIIPAVLPKADSRIELSVRSLRGRRRSICFKSLIQTPGQAPICGLQHWSANHNLEHTGFSFLWGSFGTRSFKSSAYYHRPTGQHPYPHSSVALADAAWDISGDSALALAFACLVYWVRKFSSCAVLTDTLMSCVSNYTAECVD